MKRSAGLIATLALMIVGAAASARAQDAASQLDCFGKDNERRIAGWFELSLDSITERDAK